MRRRNGSALQVSQQDHGGRESGSCARKDDLWVSVRRRVRCVLWGRAPGPRVHSATGGDVDNLGWGWWRANARSSRGLELDARLWIGRHVPALNVGHDQTKL